MRIRITTLHDALAYNAPGTRARKHTQLVVVESKTVPKIVDGGVYFGANRGRKSGRAVGRRGFHVSALACALSLSGACSGSKSGTTTHNAPIDAQPWPGPNEVKVVDAIDQFGSNLSGLSYQPALGANPAILWAVRNGPGHDAKELPALYRLTFNGKTFSVPLTDKWTALGKPLRYVDGTGNPDAEGVTKAAWESDAIYVSMERDNEVPSQSRLSVLRYDTSSGKSELRATHEWNLTKDIPPTDPNLGLEAITFIPDSALLTAGFFDDARGATYAPANYPDHGGGLFVVGVESTGMLYVYALDHSTSGFSRVSTFASGLSGVMELFFDRDTLTLWAVCDDTCGNTASLFEVDSDATSSNRGKFQMRSLLTHPTGLPNVNNEGFTIVPKAECSDGLRDVYWAEDGETSGHSLRRGSIDCE